MSIIFRHMICVSLALTGVAASADEPELAEGLDFETGETELELQSIFSDADPGTELEMQVQVEQGLSESWSIGGEIELEREPGDPLIVDSLLASVKWRAPVDRTGPFAVAFQFGAGYSPGENEPLIETSLYTGWSVEHWRAVNRLRLTAQPGSGERAAIDYRFNIEHQISESVALGAQFSGDIRSDGAAEHLAGPTLGIEVADDVELELGAFAGLNRASPSARLDVEIAFEF